MAELETGTSVALAQVIARERGRLLAVLIRQLGEFQLAEDSLQDANEAALRHWDRLGIPANPAGWLLKVARRKAIDRLRRDAGFARKSRELAMLMQQDADPEPPEIPDERLRLIFTCCHPALSEKSRIALTLRCVGGLSTREVALAFLDNTTTMGQRLSRAKSKIAAAAIPFRVPGPDEWPSRLNAVLTVIYLVFNEGYSASEGDAPIRASLCEEAIWLARLVNELCPGEAEIEGLLALMLLSHARGAARLGPSGLPVPPHEQDRRLWDTRQIEEGLALLDCAVTRGNAGPYQVQAAISALHMQGSKPDRHQIFLLYDRLLQMTPGPVVALNRAVALAEMAGAEAGLAALARLDEALDSYQPYHAARADLLVRVGNLAEADAAYLRASALSNNPADKALLEARRDALHKP